MIEKLKMELNKMIEEMMDQGRSLHDADILTKSQELDKLIVEDEKQKHPELQLIGA